MKTPSTKKKTPAKTEVKEKSFPIVAIGASAGGLEAMMELLKYLPADTGMAYIFVQHLSPDHKSMLTEVLSKKTKMKVQEIHDMDKIKPDHVFVIPYNKGIEVTDGHIILISRAERNVAISIDILFSSLAEAHNERVIGIILSGSASDGTVGIKAVKREGGLTFAQDDTAKFTSMPHSAIAAGVVDFILSPKEIALELTRLSKHPLIKTISLKNGEEDLIENSNPDLKIILNQLYKATNVDFSAYKMNTIKRRIIRRMLLYKISKLKEYAELLSQKKEEIEILYRDLLINVTSFFRDPETHKYLKEHLFPKLLKRKKNGELLRIWIPACATGEEAYSMAMMFLEIQESKTTKPPVQIFATDVSEKAISKARNGTYTKQDLGTLSPKRIQRFFTRSNGNFRINKAVREMCVFAPHNILHDPPFSHLDFISCCNLFIYLDNPAQKKAVNTFHYALNDDGFLMLGKSENITQSGNLFNGYSKKFKIFSRKTNSGSRTLPALLPRYSKQNIPITNKNKTKQSISFKDNLLSSAIDAVLVSEFMPASVVINHQMEIVQFRGATELFLTHPQGNATLNVLKMARPELAFELRNTISKVIKAKHRLRKSGIELKINSEVKIVSLDIVPLKIESDEPLLLILFTEHEQTEIFSHQSEGGKNISLAKDRRIKKLEQEIAAAHADALALAHEQEAFTEELQSANEEIVSSNEELQSVNEELETAKEETESANEELSVTNQELQTRNELLNESYDYSEAIIATMPSPMVVLDKNLRVKSASKTFYKKFKVNEEETEGILLYDLGNRQWNIPRLRELLEDILPKNSHFHDFEISHTFPFVGEKIMLLNASRIVNRTNHEELILLAFADVTEVRKHALAKSLKEKEALELKIEAQKKIEEAYKIANDNVRNLFLEAPAIICVHRGPEHVFELSSKIHQQVLGNRDIIGKPVRKAMPDLEGSGMYELLDRVYSTGEPFVGYEYPVNIDRGNGKLEEAYFNFVYQAIRNREGEIDGLLVHGVEVTEQVLARKKVEANKNQLQNIFLNAPAAIAIFEGPEHKYVLANKAYEKLSNRKAADLLGKSMQVLFPELIGTGTVELYDKVLETGESFSAPEYALMLDLKNEGVLRQYYFDFSMEALKNNSGEIYAVMAMTYDVTEQVESRKKIEESEKKEAFSLKLSDAIKELIDPVDIQLTACRILGEHVKVNRVLYGEVINEEQITINNNYVNGVSPIIATLDAEQFGRSVIDAFKRNEKVIISDITTDPGYTEEEKQSFLSLDVVANAGMGLVKGGRWVATFGMHYNAPRKWTATEIWLLEETAERTWAAVERARAEQALRKSEEKYRTLFTSIDQGFAFCELIRNKEGKGIDFYVLEVNSTYEKQAGVSAEMVVGKTILQTFPKLDKWWIETYAAVVDDQRPVVFEQYSEPSQRWLAINAYPGEKDRFAILFSDITERKQVEEKVIESESRFRTMADASPMLIWTIDVNGLSSYYNKTFLDFIGVSKDEDISDWAKIVHPDDVKSTLDTINTAIAGRVSYSLECRLLRADGQWRWVLAQGNPRMGGNNEFLGFVGSSVDITELKQTEEKLIEAKVFAENAVKFKQQFLSNMSHEIRTPLNSILGFSNVLLKTELGAEQKEFLQAIKTSGNSLNLLINDILDLAKVDAGKMIFVKQSFEIRKSIKSLLYSFDLKVKEKNLELIQEYDSKIPSMLLGDSVRLNQIILNLMSNAVKFTHKGKIILGVKLLQEEKENVTLEFSVTDSGIGIAANKINSIFNLFEQAELSTTNSYGGTGLGLAIVKQLIEAQGGRISVRSKVDEGSVFSFILPFEKTNIKSEEEMEILKLDSGIKNLRVLIAEDVALNQLLIKMILNDFGCEFEIVGNGKLAIEKLQTNAYDIVLMDLQMPEMNGFEATEYIRKTMKSQMPIIALTADVTTTDFSKCKELGMDDYISKPIDEILLYNKIVELVKKKQ